MSAASPSPDLERIRVVHDFAPRSSKSPRRTTRRLDLRSRGSRRRAPRSPDVASYSGSSGCRVAYEFAWPGWCRPTLGRWAREIVASPRAPLQTNGGSVPRAGTTPFHRRFRQVQRCEHRRCLRRVRRGGPLSTAQAVVLPALEREQHVPALGSMARHPSGPLDR